MKLNVFAMTIAIQMTLGGELLKIEKCHVMRGQKRTNCGNEWFLARLR